MSRKFFLFLLTAILGAAAAHTAFAKAPEAYRMVLLLPGPVSDRSWNATNHAGLLAVNKTLKTRMEYVENVLNDESVFRHYAERDYDLIMAAGAQFDETAARVAAEYPGTVFCVVNGMTAAKPNLMPISPKEYEASFLAGILAGHLTKSGKIGIAGAYPDDLMIRLLNTYEWAARIGRPDLKVARAYTNSWNDMTLGRQIAGSMIDSGADVLFFSNQVGLGAIQAAKENGVKFVGFATDQNSIEPGTVVASVYFDFANMYTRAVKKFLSGTLKPVLNEFGIADDIVKVAYGDEVSPEIRKILGKAEEAVKERNILFFLSGFPEKP